MHGRAPIRDGDAVRIPGRSFEDAEPAYWELEFHNLLRTNRVFDGPRTAYLEYDWIQARLWRIESSQRYEAEGLRPQEHKLIRYMHQRNRANGKVPEMCAYEDLISAIWGDDRAA